MIKTIFITGATTGMGLQLAKDYLALGHMVGICGRDLSKLDTNLKDHKNLFSFQVDVTDMNSLELAVSRFLEITKRAHLDICIANAGRSVGDKKSGPKFKEAKDLIEVNYIGVLNTFEVCYPKLNPEKSNLVAISSVAGLVGLPGAGPYSASKSAVIKFCEGLTLDLRETTVKVTTILPGFVDTPLTRKNKHSMPFLMSAEKASGLMRKAIDNNKTYYIFPFRMFLVMEVLSKIPRWLYRRLILMAKIRE